MNLKEVRETLLTLLVWFFGVIWFFKSVGELHSLQGLLAATDWLDVGWYKSIATQGYMLDFSNREGQNTAFFPLFPLLSAPFIHFFHLDGLIALHVVQKISLVGAAIFAFRWSRENGLDEKVSLVTLLLHPAFVFLFVPYTESLYLLLLFLLMLSWQKKSSIGFLLLSLWIGLCRPTGLFLMPAAFFTLLILFYREVRSHWGETRSLSKLAATLGTNDALITHVKLLVLGIAGSLTALLTVAVVMKISVDDWFAFYRYRNLWKEVRGIGNFLPFVQLDFGMHTGRVLVVWLSIWGCWLLLKSGRIFEAVFCVLSLLLPIYQGKMGDIVRYALGAAPAWMFLTAERQAGRRRLLFVTAISVGIGMQLLEKWIQRTWVG